MSVEVVVTGTDIKDVQRALTKFSRLVKKAEILEEVLKRQEHIPRSKKKKLKQERAIVKRIQQKRLGEKKNRHLNTP